MWGRGSVALRISLRVWAVVLGSAAAACLLELDPSIACGDGYVDGEAGEACDPGDPLSFIDGCRGRPLPDRMAACNPTTCQLDWTNCYKPCGNMVVDEYEECEREVPSEELAAGEVSCEGLYPLAGGAPYTGGVVGGCGEDCRWDRSRCNYCGNGRIDEQFGEGCDGTDGQREACLEACQVSHPHANVACTVTCKDDCSDWNIPGPNGGIDDWKSAGPDALECCYRQGPTDPIDETYTYDCCPGYARINDYCVLQELSGGS